MIETFAISLNHYTATHHCNNSGRRHQSNFVWTLQTSLLRGISAFASFLIASVKAGLLTSFQSQAPSHPNKFTKGQWIHLLETCLRELTAAGQSGISTPFPFNRCYTNLDDCKIMEKKAYTDKYPHEKVHALTVFKIAYPSRSSNFYRYHVTHD